MKTILNNALVLAAAGLVARVAAQETSGNTGNPVDGYLPAGISAGCRSFLTTLDADESISTCLNSLVDATAAFDPTVSTSSSGDIATTLNTICSPSFSFCQESAIRARLSEFYAQCEADLLNTNNTDPDRRVSTMYDVLYILVPMRDAVCSKNIAGNFCVLDITVVGGGNGDGQSSSAIEGQPPASESAPADVPAADPTASPAPPQAKDGSDGGIYVPSDTIEFAKANLYKVVDDSAFPFGILPKQKRQAENGGSITDPANDDEPRLQSDVNGVVPPAAANSTNQETLSYIVPETETYRTTSLPYLFIRPDNSAEQLCSKCAQNVLGAYLRFEYNTPYALGLDESPILGEQRELFQAMQRTCGSGWTNEMIQSASPQLSGFTGTTGAATKTVASAAALVGAAVLAAVALF